MSAHGPRHFSLVRSFHAADWLTLGNAAAGVSACFSALRFVADGRRGHLLVACALLPVALLLDVFDGRVARWRQKHSLLGRDLDSLADVISFGVAPALLAFAAGMRGGWDQVVLIYFVCCGVSRLARFNVTADELSQGSDKVRYFEGTPIPTSVLLVCLIALALNDDRIGDRLWGGAVVLGPAVLHPLVGLWALSGTLMISKTLRIPKV